MIHLKPTYTVQKDTTDKRKAPWCLCTSSPGLLPEVIGRYATRKAAITVGRLLAGRGGQVRVV